MRRHVGLIVILISFLMLGVLYLWTTPLLETPDEPSHFSVVKYIVDEVRLPPQQLPPLDPEPVPVIYSGPPVYYAPPLYYILGAPLIIGLDTDGLAEGVIPNPNWLRGWSLTAGRSPENKHMYVHTVDQRPPYAGWAIAMIRLRILSLLLGALTVIGVYTLACALVDQPSPSPTGGVNQRGWALAATALVAFNPVYLFTTTGVTNDALLIALTTWAFVLMARLVGTRRLAQGPSLNDRQDLPPGDQRPGSNAQGWVVLLGVVLGLAVLTKQSAFLFMPVAVLAILWAASTQPRPWRTAIKWLLLFFLLVALLAAWWYLYNTLTYNDPLGLRPHQLRTGEHKPSLSQVVRELLQVAQGYWAVFGWGLILVDPIIYVVIAIFVLIGLLGLITPRSFKQLLQHSNLRSRMTTHESRICVILITGQLLNLAGLVLWLSRTSLPYGGRLLFPTLGPLAVLLALGWRRWLGPQHGGLFAGIVVAMLGLYAFIVPWRYLRPAYASPVVPVSAAENAIPLNVEFSFSETSPTSTTDADDVQGKTIRLLSYEMAPETASPGERVTLTLYWQAQSAPQSSGTLTQPTPQSSGTLTQPAPQSSGTLTRALLEQDLAVFVQLAPRDPQQRIAGLDDYLGSSLYPSRVWQPGEVIRQVHHLRLPEDAPGPALYWFNVGLYSESGGERLAVTADNAPVPDRAVRLGPLWLLGQEIGQPGQRVDYRFGPAIRLTGYDVELLEASEMSASQDPDRRPLSVIRVMLFWQADAAPERDWTVFVHLEDAAGNLVTQHDGPPRQGDYPTWAWQPGDRVLDMHTLTLPPDLAPGIFHLQIGLYRPDDDTRAPIFDSANHEVPNAVLLLTEVDLRSENSQ